MTHITKLTEIVDGRLLPSDKKLSASLLEVDAGRLTVSGDTLGFDETGLATETYVTNAIAAAQLNGGEVDLSGYATKVDLLTKVDNVEGKGLSTNDYTDADKAKVDGIDETLEGFDAQKLDIPASFNSSAYTTPTVNSIPLYTLGNNGEYVLCTPDVWLSINGFFVPGYNPSIIEGYTIS